MENCTGNFSTTRSSVRTLPEGLAEVFAALNIFLSMTASLGNALILIALHKVTSVHPPTKLLFRCLAFTDLCVGLITQPLFATRVMLNNVTKMKWDILYYVEVISVDSSIILCNMSIFTSTAISVDRLLALLLGLRYRQVVTLRRVYVLIICFWLTCTAIVFMNNFWDGGFSLFVGVGLGALSLVISIFSYTRIFFKLRQQQAQVQGLYQGQPNGEGIPLNTARYKKTVSSIAWLQLALVACYVPFNISFASIVITGWNGMNANIVWVSTGTLLYLNSSLNPILYCWKIKEVRQAVKDTVRKFCCSSS